MQTPKLSQEFFIEPNQDIQKTDNEWVTLARLSPEQLQARWSTQKGSYILGTWKANRFDREVLDSLVGKFYGHTDLRGISLSRETLSGVDLSQVDFFAANLESSNFAYADLTDSYLSETDIRGTCFDWAKMRDVLIDKANFDNRTSFTGVKLSDINFMLAGQLQAFAFSQQRIAELKERYPRFAYLLWLTCDYGRSFARFLGCCTAVIFVFALAYAIVPGTLSESGFWNSLYFSIMTFTTLGANIQAISVLGKVLVSLEAIVGFLMTGLLVAIFVKKTIGD